jgi:hypothetical protein
MKIQKVNITNLIFLRILLLASIPFILGCKSTQRAKPEQNLTDEGRYLFFREHQLSLDESSIYATKNFMFFQTSILQGGQRLSNPRETFRYYPELGRKFDREANGWMYSWGYGVSGLVYGTLGILGFTKAIDFAPFWNYLFSTFGVIGISISVYTFATFTPDYERLIPLYNEALKNEINSGAGMNHTQFRLTFAVR